MEQIWERFTEKSKPKMGAYLWVVTYDKPDEPLEVKWDVARAPEVLYFHESIHKYMGSFALEKGGIPSMRNCIDLDTGEKRDRLLISKEIYWCPVCPIFPELPREPKRLLARVDFFENPTHGELFQHGLDHKVLMDQATREILKVFPVLSPYLNQFLDEEK